MHIHIYKQIYKVSHRLIAVGAVGVRVSWAQHAHTHKQTYKVSHSLIAVGAVGVRVSWAQLNAFP